MVEDLLEALMHEELPTKANGYCTCDLLTGSVKDLRVPRVCGKPRLALP